MNTRQLYLLSSAVLALCSAQIVSSDAISVVDDIGRRVSLPAPATRIVSLSPHITELLYSIGIGDRIVGTVRYSDYPKEAGSIQRVGDAFSINIEMLIQLEPDLVVAWQTGGSARTINKIQSFLGVPVYFNEASDLAAIGESAAKMAVLAGVAEIGAARAQQYRRKLEWIREQHESSNQVKIFYQISDLDLYTVNRHHLIGEAIALCGGDNIFADSIIKVPKVSMEAVIAASPDLIVFSSGVDAGDQWTSRWRPFDTIPAVANEHLYSLPAAILTRPSFRMASGIERLCDFMNMARSQAPVKD